VTTSFLDLVFSFSSSRLLLIDPSLFKCVMFKLLLQSKQTDELTSNIFIDNTSGYTIEYCTFVALSASEDITDLHNLESDCTL